MGDNLENKIDEKKAEEILRRAIASLKLTLEEHNILQECISILTKAKG